MDTTKKTKRAERIVTTGASAAQRRSRSPSRLGAPPDKPAPVTQASSAADAHAWLTRYTPQRVTAKDWSAVRGFVNDCARSLIDDHGVTGDVLARYTLALTKLAVYCRNNRQHLDRATTLDPYTVNQFAAGIAAVDRRSAGTYQTSLRFVGERLCPSPCWERPTPVNTRAVPIPYTGAELSLLSDQIAKNAADRRRGGQAMMALGLGAGLDGRWVAKVTREDVLHDGVGLIISVDGRLVPVLAQYDRALQRLVDATDEGAPIVGGNARNKNAANQIAARLVLGATCPRLNAGRLRSTWIVTHLTLGTRLPELAEAAGTVGITTFSDLLEFVPRLPGAPSEAQRAARDLLRGRQ